MDDERIAGSAAVQSMLGRIGAEAEEKGETKDKVRGRGVRVKDKVREERGKRGEDQGQVREERGKRGEGQGQVTRERAWCIPHTPRRTPSLSMQILATAHMHRNIPPHEPTATRAWLAYPWDELCPEGAAHSLEVDRLLRAAASEEELAALQEEKRFNPYVRCGRAVVGLGRGLEYPRV